MSKFEVSLVRTQEGIDFEPKAMADLLEDAYLNGKEKRSPTYKRKTYPPSGLGYMSGNCPRRWYYEFSGEYTRVDEIDILQKINMDYGTEAHERIQQIFEDSGILIEKERLIESTTPPVKGYVDLIVDWKGQTVGEIKTTKQENFTKIRASGEPAAYQLIQLLIYMSLLKIDRGFFLYENKNSGEILILPVMMDEENSKLIEYVLDWMTKVHKNATDDDGELPTRPFTKSKECKTCPFKDYCWEDAEGTLSIEPLEVNKN